MSSRHTDLGPQVELGPNWRAVELGPEWQAVHGWRTTKLGPAQSVAQRWRRSWLTRSACDHGGVSRACPAAEVAHELSLTSPAPISFSIFLCLEQGRAQLTHSHGAHGRQRSCSASAGREARQWQACPSDHGPPRRPRGSAAAGSTGLSGGALLA